MKTTIFKNEDVDEIFGSEVAEQEPDVKFLSYAVELDTFKSFYDYNKRFRVVMAFKGEGKSGLFKLLNSRLSAENNNIIAIQLNAYDIAPSDNAENFDSSVSNWKKVIYREIACHIGSLINVAYTDDATSLVEEAERNNFKQRSIVKYILSRIKSSNLTIESPENQNYGKIISRYAEGKEPFWLLLDDIDNNFDGTTTYKIKVASFLTACVNIMNEIPQIRIRTSIRPNVWSIISSTYDTMSHVRPHIIKISWPEESFRKILANRIKSYINSTNQGNSIPSECRSCQIDLMERSYISLLFEDPVEWGKKKRPAHVPLYTLSLHRPRWLIELCKKGFTEKNGDKILLNDIIKQLKEFGKLRLDDTAAEFKAKCKNISEIVKCFRGQYDELDTSEVIQIIKNKLLTHTSIYISGVETVKPTDVGRLLYELGFIYGRKEFPDGRYEHIYFKDDPELFSPELGLDKGIKWEIHPIYRTYLDIIQRKRH